jgi:hypothetical protein
MKLILMFLIIVMIVPITTFGKKSHLKRTGHLSSLVSLDRVVNRSHYSSNFNLCGPNQQIGANLWVYSTQCCKKNDKKECVEEQQCRRAKADCAHKDSDGNLVAIYESYGVKDCGSCQPISSDSIPEVLAP